MSYDVSIVNKKTKKKLCIKNTKIKDYGGTIEVIFNPDGTYSPKEIVEMDFNATYNYCNLFRYCLGKEGIRELYGKNLPDCLKLVDKGINKLIKNFNTDSLHKNYHGVQVQDIKTCDYKKLPDEKDYWSDSPANVLNTLNHVRELIIISLPYNKNNCLTFSGD